jgi:hypothetical protein
LAGETMFDSLRSGSAVGGRLSADRYKIPSFEIF